MKYFKLETQFNLPNGNSNTLSIIQKCNDIDYDNQTQTLCEFDLAVKSCVSIPDLNTDFLDSKAIHISKVEIFDKPKELSEFKNYKKFVSYDYTHTKKYIEWELRLLTKAPQSWQYVWVKE